MIDWNHDGKIDWKDDAFYNNVIDESNNKSTNNTNHSHKSTSNSSSSTGVRWCIVLLVIWFISILIKCVGD